MLQQGRAAGCWLPRRACPAPAGRAPRSGCTSPRTWLSCTGTGRKRRRGKAFGIWPHSAPRLPHPEPFSQLRVDGSCWVVLLALSPPHWLCPYLRALSSGNSNCQMGSGVPTPNPKTCATAGLALSKCVPAHGRGTWSLRSLPTRTRLRFYENVTAGSQPPTTAQFGFQCLQ